MVCLPTLLALFKCNGNTNYKSKMQTASLTFENYFSIASLGIGLSQHSSFRHVANLIDVYKLPKVELLVGLQPTECVLHSFQTFLVKVPCMTMFLHVSVQTMCISKMQLSLRKHWLKLM